MLPNENQEETLKQSAIFWKDKLPTVLQPQVELFLPFTKPCIRLNIEDILPDSPQQSCIGQVLYWPKGKDWPVDETGRPLFGLLQINLSEYPQLPEWPATGMLQVFISDAVFWGADPRRPENQAQFRLVFHEHTDLSGKELIEDFSFLPSSEELPWKKKKPARLSGQIDDMLPPYGSRYLPSSLAHLFDELGDEKWDIIGEYDAAIGSSGHRLGGYPFFLQDDPQPMGAVLQDLILQLDSDPKGGLLWADFGMAHWLAKPISTNRSLDTEAGKFNFNEVSYFWESN